MLQRLERQMHHRSMMAVIHMRLLFFALPPVNWFLAVIQIGFRDYWLGTLLGSLPKIALFAWVGGAIFGPLAKGHILHWYAPQFWLPPVAGVVLSLVLRYVEAGAMRHPHVPCDAPHPGLRSLPHPHCPTAATLGA